MADLDPGGTGSGARLLAATARSVTSLTTSTEALERAHEANPTPNLTFALTKLPELPFPEESLDALIALEIMEGQNPQALVEEARRVLKADGILIISAPDKRAFSNRSTQGLYAAEFRELLGQSFEHVELYRQGAVSGGMVFRDSDSFPGLSVESASFAAAEPDFGEGPPDTDLMLAVCSGTELPVYETPYLLLDRDRRLLDECEDDLEDIELLKAEIQHMQETEIKTFHETVAAYEKENARLRAGEEELRRRLQDIERSRAYRLLGTYRHLRTGLDGLINRIRGQ